MNFEIVSTIPTGAKWMGGILLLILAVWFVAGVLLKGPSSEDDHRND